MYEITFMPSLSK